MKALCDRAGEKGIRIMSWIAAHLSVNSKLGADESLQNGKFGIFAARESGMHPDTGSPGECWTLNLRAPITDYIRKQWIEVAERTGLAGYLWDSYCNMGWWQVDYSDGTIATQWEVMGTLYADLMRAGLYVEPEVIVTFSSHSACGLHGGNIYRGDLLGYSYNTGISLWFGDEDNPEHINNRDNLMLQGLAPVSELFECLAHKRVPHFNFHSIPREKWHESSVNEIKRILGLYRRSRDLMKKRTVLRGGAGVLWDNADGKKLLWSFADQRAPAEILGSRVVELSNGEVDVANLQANCVYRVLEK